MKGKNSLRKLYAVWSIIISELFAASMIICSASASGLFWDIFRIFGAAAVIMIPVIVYVFYRLRGRDNNASSDELEQLVLQKSFALGGLVSFSLLPALMLMCFLLPQYAGFTAFGYSVIAGGVTKIAAFLYNRKYSSH